MKSFLPIKQFLLIASCVIFSFAANAQSSLNGGTVSIATNCYSLSSPAPNVNSISDASGGTAPYSYQWQAKINPSLWVDVVGATGATLTPGILFEPTSYRRKVTDGTGAIAYSNTIDFLIADNINGGRVAVDAYSNAVLVGTATPKIASGHVAFNGSGSYSYSWETSSSQNGPWSAISGISTLDYQPPVYNTVGSVFFRRKATDDNCGFIGYSNTVEIKVVTALPFEARYWVTKYICVFPGNLPSNLGSQPATGGTPPYSYQWQQKTIGGSWTDIPNATSISYQPAAITETTQFRRKASDAAGAFGYTNEDAIIYSTIAPAPGTIALNTSLLIAPNAPSYTIQGVVGASNFYNGRYAWESSSDNGNTWSTLPYYGSANYYTENSPTVRTCYRRAIVEGCAAADRSFYTNIVCVDPALPLDAGTITSSNSGTCIPVGTSVGSITGTVATGGTLPYTYQWQKNDNGTWTNIPTANGANYTAPAINHNTIYRRQVTDGANTVLLSNEISVNVQGTVSLKGGIVDGPIITCSNTAPGIINNIIDACGGGGTLQYSWEYATNGGSWSAISSTNAPTHNATSISSDTKFRRKVGDGCGNAAYSNEVEIFVYPAIEAGTIFPISQTVCTNGSTEALSLMQNCHYTNGTVSYQWQKATSLSGPWNNVSGGLQPFYQARPSATAYYRLKVASTVCGAEAYSNVATITVNNCTPGKAASENQLFTSSLSTKGNMKVYPNPATQGQSVFVTVDGGDGNYKAVLRGTDGRAYNCTVTSSAKGQLQIKLPQPMAKGTYLIQVSNSNKQWIERIVVQ